MKSTIKKKDRLRGAEVTPVELTPAIWAKLREEAAQDKHAWTILGRADDADSVLGRYAAYFSKPWTGSYLHPEHKKLGTQLAASKNKARLLRVGSPFWVKWKKADDEIAARSPLEKDLHDAAFKLHVVRSSYTAGKVEESACNLALLFVLVERLRVRIIDSKPKRGRTGNRQKAFAILDGLARYDPIDLTPKLAPELHKLVPNAKTLANYISDHRTLRGLR